MHAWLREHKVPFLQALVVFFILLVFVFVIIVFGDFSKVDLRGLLFFSALVCCGLIAKSVFDSAREQAQMRRLSETLQKNSSFASKEMYLELYRNSPVPYLIIDHHGHVHSANIAASRLLDIPQTKMSGCNVFEYIRSPKKGHLDFLIQKFQSGVPCSQETVEVLRNDGQETWALMSLFKMSHIYDGHIGLMTLVDITKQKRTEEAKTQFVSLASHQLRTPLAGMKWSAELLQLDGAQDLTDRQKKYIERLLLSVKRMGVLVDDFLRVSRFELGTFTPEYSTVNLPQLFDDVKLELAARLEQKELKVESFYDEELKAIVTDVNLLRMIVSNVLTNAVKYTKPKGTIHIGYKKKDENTIHISVADNGIGIPKHDQDRIFSKLFRASNAVRDVPDGTGLGLYIVREAVSVLKGQVKFTSAEGIGTTFDVFLPIEQAPADTTA